MPDPWRKSILYRAYAANGRLLYVGVTYCWTARKSQHKKADKWFREMNRVEFCEHDSRHEAELAEYAAIKNESPMFNVVGVSRQHKLSRKRISVEAWYEFDQRGVPVPNGFVTIIDDHMRGGALSAQR